MCVHLDTIKMKTEKQIKKIHNSAIIIRYYYTLLKNSRLKFSPVITNRSMADQRRIGQMLTLTHIR